MKRVGRVTWRTFRRWLVLHDAEVRLKAFHDVIGKAYDTGNPTVSVVAKARNEARAEVERLKK